MTKPKPPGEPRRRTGPRFTRAKRAEIVRVAYLCLKEFIDPPRVVEHLMETYGVSQRQSYHYLQKAREYAASTCGGPKRLHVGQMAVWLRSVVGNREFTIGDRLAAARDLVKLLGMAPPKRVVKAKVDAGRAADHVPAALLQAMHADLAGGDDALAAAVDLAEAAGLRREGHEREAAAVERMVLDRLRGGVPAPAAPAEPPPVYGLKAIPAPKVGFIRDPDFDRPSGNGY